MNKELELSNLPKVDELPNEYTIPSENMPRVYSQGMGEEDKTCSGIALTLLAEVFYRLYTKETRKLSVSYTYCAHRPKEHRDDNGTLNVRYAVNGLATGGTVFEEDMPMFTDVSEGCAYLESHPSLAEKAKPVAEIFGGWVNLKSNRAEETFENIKKALVLYGLPVYGAMQGHAVLFVGFEGNCIKYRDWTGNESLWRLKYNKIKEAYAFIMAERMTTSERGVELIKSFEGLRLTAYKAVSSEKYYTIGYGHYGSDVYKGMTVSEAQAEALLRSDLKRFERAVLSIVPFELNQNQFDALVSFTYNCGEGSLTTLVEKRSAAVVADKLLLYNKSGGKVLAGLTRRREAERKLFIEESEEMTVTQYEELKKMIEGLKEKTYNSIEECPEWSRKYVKAAIERQIVKGTGAGLDLTDDKIWNLVITLRAAKIME